MANVISIGAFLEPFEFFGALISMLISKKINNYKRSNEPNLV
jgi:hypothetical protein